MPRITSFHREAMQKSQSRAAKKSQSRTYQKPFNRAVQMPARYMWFGFDDPLSVKIELGPTLDPRWTANVMQLFGQTNPRSYCWYQIVNDKRGRPINEHPWYVEYQPEHLYFVTRKQALLFMNKLLLDSPYRGPHKVL